MPIPTVFRTEYQINDTVTVDDQTDVSIAALANGRFTLTWQSNTLNTGNDDIRFSLRNAAGNSFVTLNDDALANFGSYDENRPAVAVLADGRVVYVWEELSAPGSISGEIDTFAMIRNADGSLFKSRFPLSNQGVSSTDDQNNTNVIGLANGHFMVLWKDDGTASFLKTSVFDIQGNQITFNSTVSTAAMTLSAANTPLMTLLTNGNVVVTWEEGLSGSAEQQRFTVLSQSGAVIKVDTDVNPEDSVFEDEVGSVVALTNGNFVIIFERASDANDIQGRLFDGLGNALGGRFDISAGAASASPRATALADGRFMVVYDNSSDILGQMMFADGTKDGLQFSISNASGIQNDPEITTLADGRVVVAWEDNRGGTVDIFAEIYDPRETGLNTSATALADDWVGTSFDDLVYLGLGNDNIVAGNGSDTIYGEAGTDGIQGEGGDDHLFGGAGNDSLNGGADNDVLNGGLGADTLNGGTGVNTASYANATSAVQVLLYDASFNTGEAAGDFFVGIQSLQGSSHGDILVGGFDANTILGGAGADWIDGTFGTDTLFGEAGNDDIASRSLADAIDGGADFDTVRYDFADVGLRAYLYDSSQNSGFAAGDTYVSVEGIVGSYLSDDLRGDAGVNVIQGLNGDDFIIGLGAGDLLIGGNGSDLFHYVSTADGGDGISDFLSGVDRISVTGAFFGLGSPGGVVIDSFRFVAGTAATLATSQFIYDSASRQLSYDQDGTGAGVKQLLAVLQAGATLVHTDILVL